MEISSLAHCICLYCGYSQKESNLKRGDTNMEEIHEMQEMEQAPKELTPEKRREALSKQVDDTLPLIRLVSAPEKWGKIEETAVAVKEGIAANDQAGGLQAVEKSKAEAESEAKAAKEAEERTTELVKSKLGLAA
jgi:hypothetical protein